MFRRLIQRIQRYLYLIPRQIWPRPGACSVSLSEIKPHYIGIHEICAGDVLRISFRVPWLASERFMVGRVVGEPGRQFRKRGKRYFVDLQRTIGCAPTCIETQIITRVELIAPGANSPATV